MMRHTPSLADEIETFLAEFGMGASYFGKAAAGNSELVLRLRRGGRVWPETETKLRDFMSARRRACIASAARKHSVSDLETCQGKFQTGEPE